MTQEKTESSQFCKKNSGKSFITTQFAYVFNGNWTKTFDIRIRTTRRTFGPKKVSNFRL